MEFIRILIDWYNANLNYLTVFLLMVMESTFLPLPSEMILPPAAFIAADTGQMNIVGILLIGTLGSLVGASLNYFLAKLLGRPAVHALSRTKVAHLLFIHERSVDHAEAFFNKYGRSATFFGRLIPAVRHLLSIAAGLAKMPLRRFWLFTFLGAGLWNTFLALSSYYLSLAYGTQHVKELFHKYFKEISWALILLGVLLVAILLIKLWKDKPKKEPKIDTVPKNE